MTNTTNNISTVSISSNNLSTFNKKMSTLVKKGKKLGIDVSYTEIGNEMIKTNYRNGFITEEVMVKIHTFEIIGETPKIEGYDFVGVAEFHQTHNIIRMNPFFSDEIPSKFKTYRECDHCNTKRNRIHTVILQEETTKNFISVGKSCVKDFLGHGDPHLIASFIANWPDFNDNEKTLGEDYESENGRRGSFYYSINRVIAQSLAIIEKRGSFVSKQKAYENDSVSTSEEINEQFFNIKGNEKFKIYIEDKHYDETDKIIEWFTNEKTDLETSNSYIYNLSVFFMDSAVEPKNFGYIASVPAMYHKEMEKIAQTKEPKKVSNWIGEIKEKIEIIVTVNKIHSFEGYYGMVAIYNMIDENGNVIVWKTNDDSKMKEGDIVKIKGTVKSHDTWEQANVKQTNILRVKILENVG